MSCEFNKEGNCNLPIPAKCGDECPYAELMDEYEWKCRDLKDCEAEYRRLEGQYNGLLDRYNTLLREISFTD